MCNFVADFALPAYKAYVFCLLHYVERQWLTTATIRMKKIFVFCSGIMAAALLTAPIYATGEKARHGNGGTKKDNASVIYVDTVDVDSMEVDASQKPGDTDDGSDTDFAAERDTLPWPQNVVARINGIFEGTTIFNTSAVGMKVYDLTADSTLFERDARQLLRPASTLKMIVAVTALDKLGADYRFKTRVGYTGKIDSTALCGDLYCKGGFDPTIDNGDMADMADSIAALGVDTIKGNICLDLTLKDNDRLGEGWCWDDKNPILSPLLVARKDEFGERLVGKLKQRGITVEGRCREDNMPGNAHIIYIKETPLLSVMRRQLKRSDNLYSEAIFYQIASDGAKRTRATARNGRQTINRLISKLGLKPSGYYIADGCGLSLYNYVSAELEVAFLRYAYRNKEIYESLYDCLPIAGVDGSLDERMRRGAAHDNVRAKTGTVTGISSLAGYCTAANGHVLCFSIINSGIRYKSSGRNFQDKICQALCKPFVHTDNGEEHR